MKPVTISELNSAYELSVKAREYFQVAKWLAIGRDKTHNAIVYAKEANAPARVIQALAQKAVAGSTQPSSGQWGADLMALAQAYVQSLNHAGLFDSALADMKRMPMATRISVVISRIVGSPVEESTPKPCGEVSLSALSLLNRKVTVVLLCTSELLTLAGPPGLALLEAEMRSAIAAASSSLLVSELIAVATPVGSIGDPVADLAALVSAINTGSDSRVWITASPSTLKQMALARTTSGAQVFPGLGLNGGQIAGMNLRASDECPDNLILGFDAAQIAADPGLIELDGTAQATADMGPPTGVVSLFQKNLLGMRSHRLFGFEPLRSDVAAVLTGVNYGGS